MKNKLFTLLFLSVCTLNVSAQNMSLKQVLQQVVDHYPSAKTAVYQVQRAQQENIKIESQLGWQLNSQAGISRDVSALGSATDSLRIAAGLSRKLSSGATLGVDASINRDDASSVLSPALANPSRSTSINLNYRHPLEKGSDNPAYTQGLEAAAVANILAEANRKTIYDQLASQLIDLFLAAASTQVKIKNIEQSIERSVRLQNYIKNRLDLGVSEEKDNLQVEAQLSGQKAERDGLLMIWQKQKISLNRLMGKPWNEKLIPDTEISLALPVETETLLLDQVRSHNPSLLNVQGQLQLAESAIRITRDAKQDNLDLVMFIGNKTTNGDSVNGSISDSDLVGGVMIEFNRGLDKSGFDAELYQAQIDRGIALENQRQLLEDLQYELSSFLAEIKAGHNAFEAYKKSAASENKKLDEAERRYKEGRADTDQLIQFESQLSLAELSVALQKIELIRRFHGLNLLRGETWNNIHLPDVKIDLN